MAAPMSVWLVLLNHRCPLLELSLYSYYPPWWGMWTKLRHFHGRLVLVHVFPCTYWPLCTFITALCVANTQHCRCAIQCITDPMATTHECSNTALTNETKHMSSPMPSVLPWQDFTKTTVTHYLWFSYCDFCQISTFFLMRLCLLCIAHSNSHCIWCNP